MSSEVDAATGNLCERTGGSARTVLCCADAPDFPNTCPGNVGACGCGPSASEEIQSCDCTDGACFMPGLGCTGGTACTPGQDQTCNDNPAISSLHGTCLASGICKCDPSFVKSPASGRCI